MADSPSVPTFIIFYYTPLINFPFCTCTTQYSDICQHLDTTAKECYATSIEVLEQALSASAVEAMQLRDEAAALQVLFLLEMIYCSCFFGKHPFEI